MTRAGQAGQGGTRATGLETLLPEGKQSFIVWGYKNMGNDGTTLQNVFPGYTVNYKSSSAHTTTSNTDGWEYVNQGPGEQSIKYWDYNATAYRFFGAAPATATLTVNDDQENHLKKITIDADATSAEKIAATPYYSRLWYSTGRLPDYSSRQFGDPVQLEFVQPFSRVRFMYKYVSPRDGVTMGEQHFQPTDNSKKVILGGKVTVTYPLMGAVTRESTTLLESFVTNVLPDGFTVDCESDPVNYPKSYPDEVPGGWYTVLPNTEQGSYTLTVSVNGENKTATVPAEFMQWQSGYSYTYIFKINAVGGVEIGWVDYAVTPWNDISAAEWTVHNW